MKKILICLLVACFGLAVYAGGLNTYDGVTYTTIQAPRAVPAATAVTSTAVNVSALKGNATVILTVAPPSTNLISYGASIQVQDSSDGSTAWSNVTALVALGRTNVATVSTLKIDTATVRKYLRTVATSTNDSTVVFAIIAGY